jgi:hypothetical protein
LQGWPDDYEEELDDDQNDMSLLDKIPGLPDISFPVSVVAAAALTWPH